MKFVGYKPQNYLTIETLTELNDLTATTLGYQERFLLISGIFALFDIYQMSCPVGDIL